MKWLFAETCHFLHKRRRQIHILRKIHLVRSLSPYTFTKYSRFFNQFDLAKDLRQDKWRDIMSLFEIKYEPRGNKFQTWDASLSTRQKSKVGPIGCNFVIPRYLLFAIQELWPATYVSLLKNPDTEPTHGSMVMALASISIDMSGAPSPPLCRPRRWSGSRRTWGRPSWRGPPSRPWRAQAAQPACFPPRGRPHCRSRLKRVF